MIIKTVCIADEPTFDAEVNRLIDEGWKPDFSTYRVTPFLRGSAYSGWTGGAGGFAGGCSNSIILTKED